MELGLDDKTFRNMYLRGAYSSKFYGIPKNAKRTPA